jgi:hypothetical protein
LTIKAFISLARVEWWEDPFGPITNDRKKEKEEKTRESMVGKHM